MLRVQLFVIQAFAMAIAGSGAYAQEVRYYEENGVTYRETREFVQRPTTAVAGRPQTRAVCGEQWGTEQREFLRTTMVPVTQYRAETYWAGLWNPFDEPYLATRYVPVTCWQAQTDRVMLPVAVRRVVPETRLAQTPSGPSTSCQQIVSRVPVHGIPASGGSSSSQVAASGGATLRPTPANVATRPASSLASGEWPTGTAVQPQNLSAPANIPTPAYARSAAPAPAYAPPGGYLSQPSYVPPGGYTSQPSYTAAVPSPAYGSPYNGSMPAADGQQIGGVSRLDKGPPQWGSGTAASGAR